MTIDHAAFTDEIGADLSDGRIADAATKAIRTYGSEIYSLLASIHRSEEDAGEVFSAFCERLWRGIGGFEGRSSFRTWAYTVAWSASARFHQQQRARLEVLSPDSELFRLAEQIRHTTVSRLQSERRSRIQELRQTLPAEDQVLLVLRVERELDWKDLARVMNPDLQFTDDTLTRECARLRKRFQAVKERLRALVEADASRSR